MMLAILLTLTLAHAADPSPVSTTCTDFTGTWEGTCQLEGQPSEVTAPLVLKQTDCAKLVLSTKSSENVYQIGAKINSSFVIRNGVTRQGPDQVRWYDTSQSILAIKRSIGSAQEEIVGTLKIVDSKLITESTQPKNSKKFICTYTKK